MPTTRDPRVVIVAEELDQTADLVVDELHRRDVPVMRFDLADFPRRLKMVAEHTHTWRGVLDDGHRAIQLERVRSVYWRRPGLPVVDEQLDSPYDTWACDQALGGLLGVLYALPTTWVNRPEVDGMASHKPVQLPVAVACGLNVAP